MALYADVAIPVAVDKVFTYLVPQEFDAQADTGKRVLVPFGRKTVTGLIVGCSPASALASVRTVTDVVDAAPVVTPDLMRLCHWVADYYQAPLGEVVKAALPHAFSTVSKTVVSLVNAAALNTAASSSRKQRQLVDLSRATRPDVDTGSRPATGDPWPGRACPRARRAGVVRTEEVLPATRRGPRMAQVVDMDPAGIPGWREVLAALPARRASARKVLEELLTRGPVPGGVLGVADLLRSAGVSSRVVRDLAREGTLRITFREVTEQESYGTEQQTLDIELNDRQQGVVDRIGGALASQQSRAFLLHGVTGSGKTQVYIEVIRKALDAGRTAIVLVPEISLTPQIVRRFKSHFGARALVVHSRMSAGDRIAVWRRALSGECRVVIGPRSAIFAPLPDLGLIVVDEEHESSYKQFDSSPRYHARDVALMRGFAGNAVVVLGSATPSVESYRNALAGKYELLELPERIDAIPMPPVAVVDMAAERKRLYAEAKERTPDGTAGRSQALPAAGPVRRSLREDPRSALTARGDHPPAEPQGVRAVRDLRGVRTQRGMRPVQRHDDVSPHAETPPVPLLRQCAPPSPALSIVRRLGHPTPRRWNATCRGRGAPDLPRGPGGADGSRHHRP